MSRTVDILPTDEWKIEDCGSKYIIVSFFTERGFQCWVRLTKDELINLYLDRTPD